MDFKKRKNFYKTIVLQTARQVERVQGQSDDSILNSAIEKRVGK